MTADWATTFRNWWRDNPPAHTDAAHDLAHFDAVWDNCETLAAGMDVDREVLCAAAYFHDLVNLPKDHPERTLASRMSAEQAQPLLANLGFPIEKLPAVGHAIQAHSFSAKIEPRTREAKILQDADRIEALGETGLRRWQTVSSQLGRPLYDPADPFAQYRALDDSKWAVDHIYAKLLRLPETMQTAAGRTLAFERAEILEDYLNALADRLNLSRPPSLLKRVNAQPRAPR